MKQKSRLRMVVKFLFFLLLFGVLLAAVINAAMIVKARGRILQTADVRDTGADCILVLGAGVRADGTPSHMLEDRLLTGIALYEAGAAPKLLMSGDHGSVDYDEVNTMKSFAVGHGVPPDDIFMDHAGFSTYESLIRARDVFGADRIVIVSQEYHLYRALWLAEALGIEAVGVSADIRTYVGQSMREVREIAARCKDFFVG
ncbi:MAG: YdcF family protein, partial [Clostridia bacterium]|nr:YdcF family protein [Clostridia bacterium]